MKGRQVRIAILREPQRAEALRAALEARGFEVTVRPVTRTIHRPPAADDDWTGAVNEADWVVFTSANAVDALARGVGGMESLGDLLRHRRVAVLGETSLKSLRAMGVEPALKLESGISAEMAGEMAPQAAPGSRVLYPCSGQALPDLPDSLRRARHQVRQLVCYESKPIPVEQRAPVTWAELDAAVVAAPSAVSALGEESSLPHGFPFVAIGPTTAAALRKRSMRVLGVAATPDVQGVVSLLESHYRTKAGSVP